MTHVAATKESEISNSGGQGAERERISEGTTKLRAMKVMRINGGNPIPTPEQLAYIRIAPLYTTCSRSIFLYLLQDQSFHHCYDGRKSGEDFQECIAADDRTVILAAAAAARDHRTNEAPERESSRFVYINRFVYLQKLLCDLNNIFALTRER